MILKLIKPFHSKQLLLLSNMEISENWRKNVFFFVRFIGLLVFVFVYFDFFKLYHPCNIFNGFKYGVPFIVALPLMVALHYIKDGLRSAQDPVVRLVCYLVFELALLVDTYLAYCVLYILFGLLIVIAAVITAIINYFR